MNNNVIKAVAFDMGGVIRLNDNENILEAIAHALNVPIDEFKHAYWEHNRLSNVNNMPWDDMIIEVTHVFDKSAKTEDHIRQLVKKHEAGNRINKDLLELFPALHQLGLKVAILSNATSELRKELDEKGIASLVDEIVISGEIGYQKPHKEAFDILFEKLGMKPEEVVFVDDSQKSLEKASEIGYMPVLFKNNEQLKIDLNTIGIFLPRE